ncbi:YceI family protein [Ulvibacter litoralis]|uniref:YceI-like domain-containing protein n=1 Tax=Ulvibacter litoralis TaxID=227084 RepID=A0A1G7EX91_9FLAO|nr:YceI family protein [Ulvibacter litoralis]GHC53632.1 hypothetical protein GCM10008083_17140 [Ulvibacter litoralis]SDE68005.1 YceI-like domain-containing protein [Ulvibacter litoralis]
MTKQKNSTIKYLLYGCVFTALLSCNNAEKKSDNTSIPVEKVETSDTYKIKASDTKIDWTAYKFTERVGVSGTFDDFYVAPKTTTGTIGTILLNAKVSINAMSVNSGNDIRDPKLKESFFEVFHTNLITGEILKTNQDEGVLELTMNNKTNEIPFKYTLKTDTIFMDTTIDLEKWDGEEAITSLNKVCYDLHKGTDGISKLWPDVKVTIKLPVAKQ